MKRDYCHRSGTNVYDLLFASESNLTLSVRLPEANMQSPSIHESPHSHTSEAIFNPVVKVTQPDRGIEGRRETCWFLKHEEDELAGHVFDSEVCREGSD